MKPAEYLYDARISFSRSEPELGKALCETLLKEFPDSPEAADAEYLLGLREYADASHRGSPPTPPQQLSHTDRRQ